MSGSLNTVRAESKSDLCAIEASFRECSRKGAVLVRWSGAYPSVLACTQHAVGHTFVGLAPKAKESAPLIVTTEEEYRRQAYEAGRRLTCRRKQCRAKPGKRCVTKGGKPAARDHSERFYDGASKAAGKRRKAR